ncbi:MAG: biopolymer transporter ExbD [Bacteroidaceae bacterium]
MGRFKVKKQSTVIDMTAMSDVTVLLLTFFMLTSTIVKPTPIKVNTPGSVSEIKIPETNILTILVEPTGKIFMSMDKKGDMMATLDMMSEKYGVKFNAKEANTFGLLTVFGVPVSQLKSVLAMDKDMQDEYLKSKQNKGIPCPNDSATSSEFKDWVQCAGEVNPDMSIAIKADATTPYAVIKNVMNSLRDINKNRYNLITSLKGEEE